MATDDWVRIWVDTELPDLYCAALPPKYSINRIMQVWHVSCTDARPMEWESCAYRGRGLACYGHGCDFFLPYTSFRDAEVDHFVTEILEPPPAKRLMLEENPLNGGHAYHYLRDLTPQELTDAAIAKLYELRANWRRAPRGL